MPLSDNALRIAVISDLHVGEGARTPDLNPFADPAAQPDRFLEHFETLVQKQGLSADVLVVPGDISDKAHPHEYRRASEVIRRVADTLSVSHENVFPVLGNHDVNWALVQAIENDDSGCGHALRFEPARRESWLASRLQCASGSSQTVSPFVCVDETGQAVIVRYNSAENDLPHNKPHHGRILDSHIQSVRDAFAAHSSTSKYRIFIAHHHPVIYSDPRPDLPDFSALVNAEHLLDALRDSSVDFFIHGHKHSPRFRVHMTPSSHPIAILCAGSFSRTIDTAWAGRITNQFHLVHMDGRHSGTGYSFGAVFSWAYVPGEWRPSDPNWAGIRHRSPFGTNVPETTLKSRFESALGPKLERREPIRWNDIEAIEPQARYLDANSLMRVLSSLGATHNSVVQFDADRPDSLLVVPV